MIGVQLLNRWRDLLKPHDDQYQRISSSLMSTIPPHFSHQHHHHRPRTTKAAHDGREAQADASTYTLRPPAPMHPPVAPPFRSFDNRQKAKNGHCSRPPHHPYRRQERNHPSPVALHHQPPAASAEPPLPPAWSPSTAAGLAPSTPPPPPPPPPPST